MAIDYGNILNSIRKPGDKPGVPQGPTIAPGGDKYDTKFDASGKPIAPSYRAGSGYQKEKEKYQNAMKQWEAGNLTSGTTGGDPNKLLSGTSAEQAGQLAGLNISALGYGQGLGQTGQDIQRLKQLQQNRTNMSGADPVTAAIMNQKAGQVAGAQRNLAASGVKGGVAAGAINNIARAADSDIAASLYGQQRTSILDERNLASNMLAGTISTMQGEKAANMKAPSAPDAGATSFICTMLRSKKLMSAKETLIMSQFMLKSLISRADFLMWYFRHGKAAVERAEIADFDWASIKVEMVDDIIELLKQGKLTQAQDLYIGRTGAFCTSFGAEGYDKKLANKRLVAVFNFPCLFFIDNCKDWLKKNFRSIPKILKAELV